MANLQLANKCNLFSYSFSGENQETLPKTQGIIPKTFQILAKKLKDLKKLKGMRPCWAYWASKKCTKNKPDLRAKKSGLILEGALENNVIVDGEKFVIYY